MEIRIKVFEVDEDLNVEGILCPICKNKVFFECNKYRRRLINIKEDGWFMLDDGLIKAHEISRETNTYKISRFEAESYLINDMAEKVMKKDEGVEGR